MARLPALIDALALCDDRPRGTIDHIARALREAGLIQTTKRGRGAAEMTARDAAALVLGLYGLADASPDAIAQAQVLGDLKRFGRATRKGSPVGEHDPLPDVLRPITTAPTLLDAVAALIELAPFLDPSTGAKEATVTGRFHAALELRRPRLSASIHINWRSAAPDRQGITVSYHLTGRPNGRSTAEEAYAVTTRVMRPVLITLHSTLFPRAESGPRA